MSLVVPTTKDIAANIVAQIEAQLSQAVPLLPKAFTRVLAKALSGVFILIYKYAGFIFLQLFVRFASDRETVINGETIIPLVEWGRLIGVGDPTAATSAEIVVDVTVTNQVGTLPAGSQLIRAETGVTYRSSAEVDLDAATVPVTIIAASEQDGGDGSGVIGNLTAGDVVSFANPLPNVASNATVVSQTVQGADVEATEVYRGRILDRFQRKPQGGAYADYRIWGEEVAGIINIYPYTSSTPGEVDVYAEATEASSGSPDGIPTAGQLTAVFDAIELDVGGLATRRPANAAVNVFAITRVAFSLTVTGLNPDTTETRAALETGIDEFLRARDPFIVGLSVLPRLDRITDAAAGGIIDDIVSSFGATVTTVALAPGPAYTLLEGEKAKSSGTVTYL